MGREDLCQPTARSEAAPDLGAGRAEERSLVVGKAERGGRDVDRSTRRLGDELADSRSGVTGPDRSGKGREAALRVEPRLGTYRDRLGELTGQTPILAGSGSTWFVRGSYDGDGLVQTRTDRP